MLNNHEQFILRKKDFEKIYSLEYKIQHLLSKGPYLEDNDYIYYVHLHEEALVVSNKLIPVLMKVFETWCDLYGVILLENGKPMSSLHRDITMGWGHLRNALSQQASLSEKIRAVNIALNVIHSNHEKFVNLTSIGDYEYTPLIYSDDSSKRFDILYDMVQELGDEEFLSALSEGEFIPKWEQEIKRRANKNINWYKLAQSNTKFFYHGTNLSNANKIVSMGMKSSYVDFLRQQGLYVTTDSSDAYSWALQLMFEEELDGIPAVLELEIDMERYRIEDDVLMLRPDYAEALVLIPIEPGKKYQLKLFDPNKMKVPIEKISVVNMELVFPRDDYEIECAKEDVEMVFNREGLLP